MMQQMEDVIKIGAIGEDDIEDADNYNEESRLLLVRPAPTHSAMEAEQCNNAFNNSN